MINNPNELSSSKNITQRKPIEIIELQTPMWQLDCQRTDPRFNGKY